MGQVCTTDAEVDAALEAWAAFGAPGAPDPAAALPPNPLARLWGAHNCTCLACATSHMIYVVRNVSGHAGFGSWQL